MSANSHEQTFVGALDFPNQALDCSRMVRFFWQWNGGTNYLNLGVILEMSIWGMAMAGMHPLLNSMVSSGVAKRSGKSTAGSYALVMPTIWQRYDLKGIEPLIGSWASLPITAFKLAPVSLSAS